MENVENKVIQRKSVVPPAGLLLNMYMSRLGKIFSNIALFGSIVLLLSIFTPLLGVMVYVAAFFAIIMVIIFTLGLIFVTAPHVVHNMWNIFVNIGDFMEIAADFMIKATPYALGIVAGLSALSIVLLSINKHDKSVWRIVLSSIIMVVTSIILVLLLVGGNA